MIWYWTLRSSSCRVHILHTMIVLYIITVLITFTSSIYYAMWQQKKYVYNFYDTHSSITVLINWQSLNSYLPDSYYSYSYFFDSYLRLLYGVTGSNSKGVMGFTTISGDSALWYSTMIDLTAGYFVNISFNADVLLSSTGTTSHYTYWYFV